ncbi:ROK family protein [Candidatus Omnitrophota bacterium]
MSKDVYIGIDLGGTTLTAGVISQSIILREKTVPTGGNRPAEEICGTLSVLIDDVSNGYSVAGIGIGVPNPAGPESDRLIMVENIPVLEGFPLKSGIIEQFDVPVVLENDANCMAIGEHIAGALRGCSRGVCITLGTGLGCGIIIDDKLYRGSGYCAGEIWNIPFGATTLLEDTVSLKKIAELTETVTGNTIDPETLLKRHSDGLPDAIEIFDRYGEAVGKVMVMVLSFLDPGKIALGGGISKAFGAFHNGMARVVEKTWGKKATDKIVPAKLSYRAALLGAALLAQEAVNG